ncbi:hypothetical protein FB451DRAFT_1551591 [Mycena latifolia]|nr:hypothetical protein FB451DRAFT_1551591 [Mycena latifolia]
MILPFRIQCFLFNNFEAAKLDDLQQAAGWSLPTASVRICAPAGNAALTATDTKPRVTSRVPKARGTGSTLVVEGGERLALCAVRVARALPIASSNDEPATRVPESLWATGSDAAHPTVEERARLVSRYIRARISMLAGSCRRVKGDGGVVPHTQQPGVDMGRTTVENVPDLFRGAPWDVVADSPDRQPLCTCRLKNLKIPGGGLATLVHPRRGPPGLIPSGQLIAR